MKKYRSCLPVFITALVCLALLTSCGGGATTPATSPVSTQPTTSITLTPTTPATTFTTATQPPTTPTSRPPTTTTQPTATTTPTTTTPPVTGPVITIEGFSFNPNSITVKAGTTITWRNLDGTDHTVTSDISGEFSLYLAGSGGTASLVFNTPGTFYYHCDPHPEMRASITVTA